MAGQLVAGGNRGCLIVAPHPDDETIGAGVWMARHRSWPITVLHITDGSPRDLRDAQSAGFRSRKAYAAARRRELHQAMGIAGINRNRLRVFSYVDKEVYRHLPELVARLTALIEKLQPSLVLSPAYEGGHPDHDSTALAVAAARRNLTQAFRHREYPLYHAAPDGAMITGEFLHHPEISIEVSPLSRQEQAMKRAMLASFTTQQHILNRFAVSQECFRDAPVYDFTQPPHEGKLLYEYWDFGVSGAEWRSRTRFYAETA